jgi:hypothetical protein
LRDAAFDSNLAIKYSRVCRRWRHLCCSDDFYRRVELRTLTGRTLFAGDASQRLKALLERPQYRSVCDVAADGVVMTPPVFSVLGATLSRLRSISFAGCAAVNAEPILGLLQSLPSLDSLDFSCSSSASRLASPVAPKWIARILHTVSSLKSLDLQSCKHFTTESLNLVAKHCTGLTLLNISYTEAKIDSPTVFGRLVGSTRGMRAFYCCGLSLPNDIHGTDNISALCWAQLRTISIGCQKPAHAAHHFQASQVRVLVWWGQAMTDAWLRCSSSATACCSACCHFLVYSSTLISDVGCSSSVTVCTY